MLEILWPYITVAEGTGTSQMPEETPNILIIAGGALILIASILAWRIFNGTIQDFRNARRPVNFGEIVAFILTFGLGVLEIAHSKIAPYPWVQDFAFGIMLVVLAQLSLYLVRDRIHREELLKEVRLATEGSSDIKVYTSWNETKVQELIATARNSISIVDSWHDEPTQTTRIIKLASTGSRQLKVDIYMADKEKPYGEQRLKEIGEDELKAIAKSVGCEFEDLYGKLFDAAVAELQIYLRYDKDVELHLHKHSLMPGLRMVVVDDAIFVFSWFPVGSVSVKNVCFSVSRDTPSDRSQHAVRQLRSQLKQIIAHSKEVPLAVDIQIETPAKAATAE